LVFPCFQGKLRAQAVENYPINGKVLADDGTTLPGVTVLEKGTPNGTTTDIDGQYRLEVNGPEATLVFSYIGYVSQEVVVSNQSVIDITLETDLQQLSEVVVVGYGTQRKKDLTGSITTVKGDDILQPSVGSFDQMLQGK